MKKTCYALLVGLASLALAGAQTNQEIQPAQPAGKTVARTSQTSAVSPTAMDKSSIAYSNLMQALHSTNPATFNNASAKTEATTATTSAGSATATNHSPTTARPSAKTASGAPTEVAATATTHQAAFATGKTNSTSAKITETTNTEAVASGSTAVKKAGTNAIAAADSETAANTNAPAADVGIPEIKFSDVPITTAIENLARLANINYMLDPKIGYGQPDASGHIKAEPTLSIRWKNITAKNALLALLDNYGLQLIVDKQTGIDRITTKDPTAPPPMFTKVVQLKYAGVSNIVDAARSVLTDKRSKVLTDARTSQLIVVATEPEQEAVETLVARLDKPTRQVLIATRLAEVSSNPSTKKGVDWTGTLQSQQITFGNGNAAGTFTTTFPGIGGTDPAGRSAAAPGSTTTGTIENNIGGKGNGGFSWTTKNGMLPDIGFLNASGLSAVLSFLNSSSDAQVMSTPRIVTLDNQEATISVTRGYPVFNVTAGTANTSGGSQVNYTNVGTILHVTPRISANNYIWLKVKPEVSSFFGNFQQTVGDKVYTAPLFDVRKIATQVFIPNANTLVMGGLVQDNPNVTTTKVPLLGDIPGLGFFFRSEDKSLTKDNLLIFITPTIVQDSDFQVAKHSSDFLKSKPVSMKEPMNPKTAWDGPMPDGNWSDPINDLSK